MRILAHIDRENGREQTLQKHCRNVEADCESFCRKIGLANLGRLTGLLHDSGKGGAVFQQYLQHGEPSEKGSINHSSCGARYVYEHWKPDNTVAGLTAQLAATAVCSHHSGLPDVTGILGEDNLFRRIYPEKEIHYEDALAGYFQDCASPEELKSLFAEAQQEVQRLCESIQKICGHLTGGSRSGMIWFLLGFTQRYLLSCLLDADRYDTYLFASDTVPDPLTDLSALWGELGLRLETYLKTLPAQTPIDRKRSEISEACLSFSSHGNGIYRLAVPTGGGKTLSSLRFALSCAKEYHKDHIYYVAPLKSILEQNAEDIRKVLQQDDVVLEHHSDVVDDSGQYDLLTQRWASPVILTTTVQFLNTLLSGKNGCVRRMHSLANSVIILDEVQAIPVKCIHLFNAAVNFLAYVCNCAVILCTATQPEFSQLKIPALISAPGWIVPNLEEAFAAFRRTRIVDKTTEDDFTAEQLADFVQSRMRDCENLLVILNTKSASSSLFRILQNRMEQLPEEDRIPVYFLNTSLCPRHRMDVISDIRTRLGDKRRGKNRLICVSTQLIEAGVNLSFQCVIRSLAGLDSIAQAAGRCNRHGEAACRDVFVVRSAEENLSSLPDIQQGQEAAAHVLENFRRNPDPFGEDLLSPEAIQRYYHYYYEIQKGQLSYPIGEKDDPRLFADTDLFDLLSVNSLARKTCADRNVSLPAHPLHQAFETAGNIFEVIEKGSVDVIVYYKEGGDLIERLYSNPSLKEMPQILREAQRFSVHLFGGERKKLDAQEAIDYLPDFGVAVLRKEFYDAKRGVRTTRQEMQALIY